VSKAGVPIVPGTEPGLRDEELQAAAEEVGYPLLIKAAAGGGGKGMRRIDATEDFASALQGARRESEAAFGDGTLYLERLIEGARHVEIQILADQQGHAISLGERECSIQRRHQKLVEEAPSPFVDDPLRRRMGRVAIRAARAVDYVNAGTVEFLVDKDHNFYFLEMNTRLQVEHPVTEMVTGIDIVREQIRIARGRRIRRRDRPTELNGWAIECRINAEAPYNDFLPSTGRITAMVLPSGPGVRLDNGVVVGTHVTPHYDPLVSKLICWGETRAEALMRMRRALEEYRIMGIETNIPFHQNLLDSPSFQAGQYDTSFVEERFSMDEAEATNPEIAAILATLTAHRARQEAAQVVAPGKRDASNWKWVSRWERIHR
jgi:acetyl/propionyl-CoA carboxylase alpha subunit